MDLYDLFTQLKGTMHIRNTYPKFLPRRCAARKLIRMKAGDDFTTIFVHTFSYISLIFLYALVSELSFYIKI